MRPAHRAPVIAALATAAALIVAGCGTAASSNPTPPAVAAPSDAASVSPAPAPPPPPAPPAPAATSSPAAGAETPSSAPAAAALNKYTFPDGRLSFEYPADWRVELFPAADAPSTSRSATVFDASGTEQATVYAGQAADGVAHPVTRTVFESEPVPGLAQQPAPAAHYSFYVDRAGDITTYRMHLTAGEPTAGDDSRIDGIIRVGDGVLVADVKFIENPFASDEAAKSWLASDEGDALKELLLSMSYR
jgi:hypothetical protein